MRSRLDLGAVHEVFSPCFEQGWLPLFDIFLSEDEIEEVLIKSDKTLGTYAGPSGEANFLTSAHIYKARKA